MDASRLATDWHRAVVLSHEEARWFNLSMGFAKRQLEEIESRGFGATEASLCAGHLADRHLLDRVIIERVSGACFHCGRLGDDLVAYEDILTAMMRVLNEEMEPALGRPWPGFDTVEVLNHYFDDVFAVDDPSDIIASLSAMIEVDEWDVKGWIDDDHIFRFSPAAGWQIFSELVQHSSRFIFVKPGGSQLPDGGVDAAKFVQDFQSVLTRNANSLVRTLRVGEKVFRGRLVDQPEGADRYATAGQLGASPPAVAGANRMSPAGISMFYASGDPDTAVQEIAAHDAKQREFALVGGFRILRELRILDLTDVDLPSVFDEKRYQERRDLIFVRSFATDITRPIRLDGREHREYAPTQVLTELVRWAPQPAVDGIKLLSAQSGRATYVLFFGYGSAVDEIALDESDGGDVVFSLAPSDIELYRVQRRVESQKHPHWRWPKDVPGGA